MQSEIEKTVICRECGKKMLPKELMEHTIKMHIHKDQKLQPKQAKEKMPGKSHKKLMEIPVKSHTYSGLIRTVKE